VQRTGVAKTTVYRHWPSRDDLLIAVIMRLEDSGGPLPDSGSVRQDLLLFFAGRVRVAGTRQWERCMPALVEAAASNPELAQVVTMLTARFLSQIEGMLLRGRDRGELRGDVRLDLAASALMGPFVFRRLLLHKTPTSAEVMAVLDMLLHGISRPEPPEHRDTLPSS
jgi:AcrR family transcriptional regulator